MGIERDDRACRELIEWAKKDKVKNGKYPSKQDFAVHYNGRWISLQELIEYARKRGIEI